MAAFRTTNPCTGETINEYSHWNASQISSSLAKSESAHQKWRKVQVIERLSFLDELKKNLDDQKQDLAFLAVLEMGKTLAEAISELEKC